MEEKISNLEAKKSGFNKLFFLPLPLLFPVLPVPDNSENPYIFTAAAQHILTYNVLLRVLV